MNKRAHIKTVTYYFLLQVTLYTKFNKTLSLPEVVCLHFLLIFFFLKVWHIVFLIFLVQMKLIYFWRHDQSFHGPWKYFLQLSLETIDIDSFLKFNLLRAKVINHAPKRATNSFLITFHSPKKVFIYSYV